MKVRVTHSRFPDRLTTRGQKRHGALVLTDVIDSLTGGDYSPPPIALDDHNIDQLMTALMPIFQVRRQALAIEEQAREDAARADRLLTNIVYPV